MSFFSSLAWTGISFLLFTVLVAVISAWKTRDEQLDTAEGYFLAGRGLPGVVIAGSLLLTNLSAEQLVGLNGQSWKTNMGPIAWEVGSMFTLLVLAYYFLPKYLKMGAMTIPSLMEERYGKGTKTSGEVQIIKDIAQPIDGRDLLIVEDILDSGVTLHYLMQILAARGANSIRLCTLLSKPERRKINVDVDYLGFEIPDEFVVGYGLDYAEKYRNLPYIGVLKPYVYGGE